MEISDAMTLALVVALIITIAILGFNKDGEVGYTEPPAKPAAPGSYADLQRQLQEKQELIKLAPVGSEAFGQLEDEIWDILTQLHGLEQVFGHQMEETKS